MTQTDGNINHVTGLKESILWKLFYCTRQSTVKAILSVPVFSELEQNMNGRPQEPKQSWGKIGAGGIEGSLTSDYTLTTVIKTVWYWHKRRNVINETG